MCFRLQWESRVIDQWSFEIVLEYEELRIKVGTLQVKSKEILMKGLK